MLFGRQHPAGTSMAELLKEAWGYTEALPCDNIQRLTAPELQFQPNWGPGGGQALTDLAYATWSFDTGTRTGAFEVVTRWSQPPADGTFWIGLADRNANTWRWHPGSATHPLALPLLEAFTGAGGELLVVIALTGVSPDPAPVLSYISIGDGALQIKSTYKEFGVDADVLSGISNLAFVDGHPAFAMVEATSGNLQYYHATDPRGETWAPPVELGAAQGAWPGLAEVGGTPALVSQSGLTYQRATAADGSAWASPVSVSSEPVSYCKLLMVNGNPAIVYTMDDGSDGYIKYIRANDALGATWPATAVDLSPAGSFRFYMPAPRVIGGKPCVAFTAARFDGASGLYTYCMTAQDADGAAWNAVSDIFYDSQISFNNLSSVYLLDLNGVPGVGWFYEEYPPNTDQSAISFRYALDPAGGAWSPAQTIFSMPQGYDDLIQGQFTTVEMDGQLYAVAQAITYNEAADLSHMQYWLAPVQSSGAVDWTGLRAHVHASADPPAKGGAAVGALRRASIIMPSVPSADLAAVFDSPLDALLFYIILMGTINNAINEQTVKFVPQLLDSKSLDWLAD
jgi:hypothetical protein